MPHLETKAERLEYLQLLKATTNTVLDEAGDRREEFDDAVNWRGLRCVAAEYRLDSDGYEYFSVIVEEVAPDASALQKFIAEKLSEAGFPGVQVETEW